MKIMRMALENFKGIRHAEFAFNGNDANIYGANAAGKTTVFDAFTWLLFGKPSEERPGFSPKTITSEGAAHNLDHSVECEIEADGEAVTFRRVYHEVYKKTRGNARADLTGHTTDYYINGEVKKEKEYQRYWEDIFPDDEAVKLLTMPYYFPEALHWEKRRALLLEICGNISDSAIMETDAELAGLIPLLGKMTVDGLKKTVKAQKAQINRSIELLPARIDEAEKAIPDITGLSADALKARLGKVRQDISDAEQERAALLSGGDKAAAIRAQISELNARLSEARGKYADEQQAVTASFHKSVNDARRNLTNAQGDLAENKRNLDEARRKASDLEKRREYILTEYRKKQAEHARIQSETFDESATICDKCGQPLPEDKVNGLLEAFNERKSNRLNALTESMAALIEAGKAEASKDMLAEAQGYVKTLEGLVEGNEGLIIILTGKVTDAEKDLRGKTLPPFEQSQAYADITGQIAAIKESEKSSAPDTSAVDAKMAGYRLQESDINAKIAALSTEAVQRQRIKDLENEEKTLGKQFEEAERTLYLCEKFTRVKSALLNDKINEKFSTVRFQLFKRNITNDGIDDICDVLVPSDTGAYVPFADANKAARLNAGLEIIGVLGEHYGIELPIFVDNAESVTDIIPTHSQLIRLIVSANDKTLRLELEG
ncbi:MAG: AAA family ATPase [Clostridium sp.]|jgi:DNA repair exonuclease SbcCD ATPase subunit|nr:AAA family ATPase [Clostridium sp.]